MTLNEREKELELFNAFVKKELPELFEKHSNGNFFAKVTYDSMFGAWLGAKAQAVPEHIITLQRNDEVFKFDLLDLLRRSLKSSKVLKTRENWSHVSKMVGIGSTTSTLLCKAMKVNPDGLSFVESESGAEG
ncbi:hypothetical protein [Acinetobacter lactucae]|uniref:Uncharacterized protein n=1 Tax=Acinetobacter lactucae TaxID=1785128 RepID=R8YVU5_9GAMM|nr:hypothetical protein [Acinetobacter lactucae]EOQ73520.1 hypothetical protein F929_03463 [Acinetobacter lactucae]